MLLGNAPPTPHSPAAPAQGSTMWCGVVRCGPYRAELISLTLDADECLYKALVTAAELSRAG